MDTIKTDIEKINAIRMDNILYLDVHRSKILPAYAYYLLEYYNCNRLCFTGSKKVYKKDSLKGKEDWKDVKNI